MRNMVRKGKKMVTAKLIVPVQKAKEINELLHLDYDTKLASARRREAITTVNFGNGYKVVFELGGSLWQCLATFSYYNTPVDEVENDEFLGKWTFEGDLIDYCVMVEEGDVEDYTVVL